MRSAQLFRNGNAIRVFRPFWDSSRSQKFGRTTLNQKDQEDLTPDPYEGNFSFTECDQYTKVSVIGAAGRVGKTLSLLLKTCPLIDHLCLFDTDKAVKGVGVDISHIDTKCNVSCVCGMRNIQQALNAPDVVIIAAGCPASPQLNGKNLFEKNAPIIAGLSEACARFCPKACIILITSPINSLLPVVGSVYQIITNRIPSRKLFGLTTLDVVRANTFVAEVVRKDPNSIIVPVIGGSSQETLVPVISQMKPCCKIKRGETVALTECLKRAEENLMDCQNCGTRASSSLSTAYAGFRFTTSLVMALKGAENIIECAFVKSEVIPELEYLASPLKLGIRGIEYNFGYPPLSDYELAGFEQSATTLMRDIAMGKAFVASIEDTIQKGLIWKRLTDESGKTVAEEKPSERERMRREEKEFLSRRRRTEESRRREEVIEVMPTPLTQEVYSEGMRNWAARASFKRFFGPGEVHENCEQMTTNSLSADLASDTCRNDPSLQKSQLTTSVLLFVYLSALFFIYLVLEELLDSSDEVADTKRLIPGPIFVKFRQKHVQHVRAHHTMGKNVEMTRCHGNTCRTLFTDQSQKMLIPIKNEKNVNTQGKRKIKFSLGPNNVRENQYKSLNAAAKQKYRSFNVQKKFTPSASVLLLLDKQKRDRAGKFQENETRHRKEEESEKAETTGLEVEEEEEDETKEEGKEEGTEEDEKNKWEDSDKEKNKDEKQLVVRSDGDKYRDIIFRQLRELKKENEELKKKLSKFSDNRQFDSSLQNDDTLELERTKLKACWLVMSSTMDAVSNFCKKFTHKTDGQEDTKTETDNQEDEQEEEYEEDERDEPPQKKVKRERDNHDEKKTKEKNLKYDEKYFKFLQKLMEDQIETQLDERRKTRLRKYDTRTQPV